MQLQKMMKGYHGHIFAIFRVLVGLMFFMHGAQKVFGWFGGEAQTLSSLFGVAGVLEIVVGLAVLLGLWTRLAALIGGVEMLVAYFFVHVSGGWNPLQNGGELAIMYVLAFLVLLMHGAGSCCSLEKKLWKKERF
tara:strand:- start:559 stop:963 length:405 start_codon:yes stop_codon:yes gene_type:complete